MFPWSPGYLPKLTEKKVQEMRGVSDRGLLEGLPKPETAESIYDRESRTIVGCPNGIPFGPLPRDLKALDSKEIRRLFVLSSNFQTFHNGTACLFKLASVMQQSLSTELSMKSRQAFLQLVEALVEIRNEIVRRTEKPYRVFGTVELSQPLNKEVLQIPPLQQYKQWQTILDHRKDILDGTSVILEPIPIEGESVDVLWERIREGLEKIKDDVDVLERIEAAKVGDTPTINGYIQNLKELKFSDIEKQTRARFPAWRDESAYDRVELIIYHSAISVLLDKNGNPTEEGGLFPYALMVPKPGDNVTRYMQPGLSLSTRKDADYQFIVNGKKVKNIMWGGVSGFVEYLNTFNWPHELQQRLQQHIDARKIYAIAAISVAEGLKPGELSFSSVRNILPDLIRNTKHYALLELQERLKNLYENYDDILLQVGKEFIIDLIKDRVAQWVREYLIKKLGKKVTPLINIVSSIVDLIDQSENEMMRQIFCCVILAATGNHKDDMTISSKILSKIAMDKVQAEVVARIKAKAKEKGMDLVKKAKDKISSKHQKPATKDSSSDKPDPDQAAKQPKDLPKDVPEAKAHTDDPAKKKYDVLRDSTEEEWKHAEQTVEAKKKRRATEARTAADKKKTKTEKADDEATQKTQADEKATHEKKTDGKHTDNKALHTSATSDPAATASKPARTEPPLPTASKGKVGERLAFYQKNINDYPPHIRGRIDKMKKKPSKDDLDELDREVAWDFYQKHRDDYPPHIQTGFIDRYKNRKPTEKELSELDRAIREAHAADLTKQWGIPVLTTGRIATTGTSGSGGDWEQSNQSLRTGKRPALYAVSTTKDGKQVQIDDFIPEKRVAREYKASLEIKGKSREEVIDDVRRRMETHSQFAVDRNLNAYEWVANSKHSKEVMVEALADLKGQAMKMSDRAARDKVLARYNKIQIVEEYVFE